MSYNKMEGGGSPFDGQMDWGENGGKCYDICDCAPCCSGYCCITWYCCGYCNAMKLYAWSMDQECALVNHCLAMYCCGLCAASSMRYGIRKKAGVQGGGPLDGCVGDMLMVWCCGACAGCQELRAAHKLGGQDSWDFFGKLSVNAMVDPLIMPPLLVK
eukprot:TRINITY_DN596_c1_g1_i1.p2 TRINITY_DN596_c1_g1~~TRINITY_DN596_c1_g1_i1.p2  ORF type:complete len:158 (+),score=25.46 TRINITY_DN596_c1_g1_i1:59-532(+)